MSSVEHDEQTELGGPRIPGAARLVIINGGPGGTRTFPLSDPGAVLIGRAETADIQLDARAVSRSHARLTLQRGEALLVDLGSSNGTFVNGERLMAPRALRSNDVITLGNFSLVYDAPGAPEPDVATAAPAPSGPVLTLGDRAIVVADPAMIRTYDLVRKLADSPLTVLILGETGVGKEIVASALHHWSSRRGRRLVATNCAAVPETLIESELFGHEKGAFSGALATKVGLLERADGGTVVLDEIGELALGAQAKLLRVLETRRLTRIGGVDEREIDVRVVASTNRNLSREARAGRFRQDLFFRLSGGMVWVPPLRDRPSDVPVLATTFIDEAASRAGRPRMTLSPEAREVLVAHTWPGNVRELKNVMERAAILVDGNEIQAEELAPWLEATPESEEPAGLRGEIERREADAIRKALEAANWNVTQAAAGLGIDRTNLHRKMRKYGLARR